MFTNSNNGKQYIGATNNLKRRFWEHKSKSKKLNFGIYQAIRKYGFESFQFEIVEIVEDIFKLNDREIYWISFYKPRYNMTLGGAGVKGHKTSDEVRLKLKVKAKKQWENKTDEEKNKIIKGNLTGPKEGYVFPEETKQRLRVANLGNHHSDAHKLKMSNIMKKRMIGNKNGNKKIVSLKNGVVVKEYNSCVEAANELGIHPTCITHVLKGQRKSTAGFNWEYKL